MRKGFLRALGLFLTCGIALAASACGKKKNNYTIPSDYKILWQDEFDAEKLDEAKWIREVRPAGWTNNELQEYTKEESNGFIRDGKFVIKGIEYESGKYSSCKLRNTGDYAFKYGRIEVSAKVPEGKGLWPAIWMMPKDESFYGQWPKCGEIDIMEVLGDDVTKAYGTVHYGEPHGEKQGYVILDKKETYANSFHTYTVDWQPGCIEWFIDGESYLKVNDWYSINSETGVEQPYPAPFNQPFCIQLNLAIGGNWPGNPEPNASYMDKAEFEIDYVRVYQKDSYDENVTKPEKTYREPYKDGNYCKTFDEKLIKTENEVGWLYKNNEGGAGSAEIISSPDKKKGKVVKITTTNAGSQDYSIQFLHTVMPFIEGKTYTISFDAWADEARTINEVCIDAPQVGWSRYWKQKIDLGTSRKTYTYTFTMIRSSDDAARLEFNMGNAKSTATIYIANVVVKEKA